jgi:16S rRNA (cytosine1402-N4)-methyltransferase
MASIRAGEQNPHKSVLVAEVLEYLSVRPHGVYIDATFGAGGHTQAILDAEPSCSVIGIDWDGASVDTYGPMMRERYGDRVRVMWGNFAQLYALVRREKITAVHGVLADFGTSQMQLTDRAGFSFKKDTPLDMRMSPAHQPVTAAQVVNTASEEKLREIFFQLGEERFARNIARAIVEQRQARKIMTTQALAEVVERAVPAAHGYRRIHPATKVFQALRIYINHELHNIEAFLAAAMKIVMPGGRIVCISFHSLEDRLVKDFFREQEVLQRGIVLTKRVVIPTEEEVHTNASSRSAKLRALERCSDAIDPLQAKL